MNASSDVSGERQSTASLPQRFPSGLAAALSVSGCGTSKPLNVAYDPAGFGAPDPVTIVKVPDVIAPGNKLRVTVFQVESLASTASRKTARWTIP